MFSAVLVVAVAHVTGILLTASDLYRRRARPVAIDLLCCFGLGAVLAIVVQGAWIAAVVAGLGGAALTLVVRSRVPALTASGAVVWTTLLALTVGGTVAAVVNLATAQLSTVTAVLVWVVLVLGVVRTPPALMQTFENWEGALRCRRWSAPDGPITGRLGPEAPFVTMAVPTYAEPPDVVIGTLDALARLDYPNFAVLVVDNNTADEHLWRPVEAHCATLGERFQFLHVEGIEGAKAGALNWSRAHLDPRTEIVALIDADYQVVPEWLAHTVGYLDDPAIAFVQSPHAYRDTEHSTFQRMADPGFWWSQCTEMVSRTEQGAGLTIGTLSVIRLAVLDEVGGWAGWCITEDSEFAIRAHAAGYGSVYVRRIFGRGLVPETVDALKKQRYRWTYGPGQEFKAHLPLYLRDRSALTPAARLRHFHYGFLIFTTGLGVASVPISLAVLVSMAVHGESPAIGTAVLVAFGAGLVGRRVMRWAIYRRIVDATRWQTLAGTIALLAVRPTVARGAVDVLLGRPAHFRRTDKFPQLPDGLRALRSTATELVFCLLCVLAAVAVPIVLPAGIATVLLALGFAWQAYVFACAPAMAVIAERDLRRTAARVPQPV